MTIAGPPPGLITVSARDPIATTTDDSTPALALLLGASPKVQMLAALLDADDRDLNVTEIARRADLSRNTVYAHLDDLLSVGVVVHTRDVGDSPMYRIDDDSDVAADLARLARDVAESVSGLADEDSGVPTAE